MTRIIRISLFAAASILLLTFLLLLGPFAPADAVKQDARETDALMNAVDKSARATPPIPETDRRLFAAITRQDLAATKAALDSGANPNAEFGTALSYAASTGDEEIVRLILQRGAAINPKEEPLLTCFPSSVRLVFVNELIARGAEVVPTTLNGTTPLSFWSEAGRTDIVRLLLKHGAKIDDQSLAAAAQGRQLAILKLFVKHGANLQATPERASDILTHAAVGGNNVPMLRWLLHKGLNINGQTNDGDYNPLQGAAYIGSTENVKFLIANGANVNLRDERGWTALRYAKHGAEKFGQSRMEIIALLKAAGARE